MAAVGGSSGEGTATTAAPPMASSSTPSLQYERPGGAWHCGRQEERGTKRGGQKGDGTQELRRSVDTASKQDAICVLACARLSALQASPHEAGPPHLGGSDLQPQAVRPVAAQPALHTGPPAGGAGAAVHRGCGWSGRPAGTLQSNPALGSAVPHRKGGAAMQQHSAACNAQLAWKEAQRRGPLPSSRQCRAPATQCASAPAPACAPTGGGVPTCDRRWLVSPTTALPLACGSSCITTRPRDGMTRAARSGPHPHQPQPVSSRLTATRQWWCCAHPVSLSAPEGRLWRRPC